MRLSYSSLRKVASCEQKYWHYKVGETPIDTDCEPSTDALDIGKCLHDVLEKTLHQSPESLEAFEKTLLPACSEFNITGETKELIYGMCMKYYEHAKASQLNLIICEAEVSTPEFIGYLDAIFSSQDGYWWITDIKTAARFDHNIVPRLHKDLQLSFYKKTVGNIAAGLGLDPEKFGGCIYRTVTKPKTARKKTESEYEHMKRIKELTQVLDVIIPAEAMDVESQWGVFNEYYQRAKELHEGRAPIKNYSACFDYFRPCEWFSRCYGVNFTDAPLSKVMDVDNYRKSGGLTVVKNVKPKLGLEIF